MKAILGSLALASAIVLTAVPADAKGCIKGAIVGAVAGHYAHHHALIGAAAGCVLGRHMAKKHELEQHGQDAKQNQAPDPDPTKDMKD
jgi:hypothetical protein